MIPPRPSSLALEQFAWQLVEHADTTGTVQGVMARELLLLLHQLERTRRLFGRLEEQLDETARQIASEMLHIEMLYTRMSPQRAERHAKLLTVQAELRRLSIQREQHLHALREQLVAVLNKYAFVVPRAD